MIYKRNDVKETMYLSKLGFGYKKLQFSRDVCKILARYLNDLKQNQFEILKTQLYFQWALVCIQVILVLSFQLLSVGAFWTKNVCEPPQNFSTRSALGPAYYFYLRGPTPWLICLPYLLVDYARNFASRNRDEVRAVVTSAIASVNFQKIPITPIEFS